MTPGVVRVGDTVRRPVTQASLFVARLLGHLERRGYAGAPRHLGLDAAGRDTFSYLPGEVPARFRRWTDAQVAAAGALLRSLHDATRGCVLAGACPVVCHHDPGPNNAVFRDGLPYAFIDFDTAAPGDPLEDVGYALCKRKVCPSVLCLRGRQARHLSCAPAALPPFSPAVRRGYGSRQDRLRGRSARTPHHEARAGS
ncbi:phosphotransferase family protein [Streptomyces hokutonensis]|uniref:phosphotransferase family protein n=1 Tax=Streptomyces hokutonensis TaxID=1306990 RepID=UPI00368C96A0